MAHLNQNLQASDFYDDTIIRRDDRSGFKGVPRVVRIQGPFKLYKLTGDRALQHPSRHVVTPWWSPVDPYLEDFEGALGRYKQAYMNGIDLSSMVRYMSAVKVEWNTLKEYVEISIKRGDQVSCFWGEFAPMPLTSNLDSRGDPVPNQYGFTSSGEQGYSQAELPPEIGALSAWQFFIPKLTNDYIEGDVARTIVDAHDMGALGAHFGLDLGSASDLGKVSELLRLFYRNTRMGSSLKRHPTLQKMDECAKTLWNLAASPKEILRGFCVMGDSYLANPSGDPRPVQERVKEYLVKARRPL